MLTKEPDTSPATDEQLRRASILIAALLIFHRDPGNAQLAFDRAERFVDVAGQRGYDLAAIASLDGGADK